MIFSENKLREIANIDSSITLDEVVKAINSIGFEVESVEKFNKNKGIKFGHVLEVYKNPNSNKLNVCKIQFDDGERIIQTAAQNVKNGDYLMAFVPGSEFNGITIKEKELGKIMSHGMLISFEELGFDKDLLREEWKENILIIDEIDLKLDPIEYFDLNDNLINVTILSNRSDAQSYYILARELAAFFKTNYTTNLQDISTKTKSSLNLKSTNDSKLNGVEVLLNKEFKFDLKKIMFILKSKIKSTNNFEDLSSYLMLYTGVYPRIIDIDKTTDKNFTISKEEDIFYLRNNNENVSILGVDILKKYSPDSNSRRLLFEFSQINSKIVRENARNSKITNQSSINCSKKIANGSMELLHLLLLNEFKNVSLLINHLEKNNLEIDFDKNYLIKYAGCDITETPFYKKSIDSLKILGFEINNNKINIPSYRHDISTMQDIVEEIFRFYGLNNFEPKQPAIKTYKFNNFNNLEKTITFLGYSQVWTYTLINKNRNEEFNPFQFKNKFNLKTYVSDEYNSIRNSIACSIFDIYEYNLKRKIDKLSLFDIGMINDKMALMISSNEKSYKQIKQDLETITNQKFDIRKLNNDKLHPNYNAGLFLGGQQVGWIGKFNPFWINYDVIFAEIFLDVIYQPNNLFEEYDPEPLKERDITISLDRKLSPIPYLNQINLLGKIYSINLVSTYEKNDNIINWSYKIKMPTKVCDIFDKNIENILKQDVKDIF